MKKFILLVEVTSEETAQELMDHVQDHLEVDCTDRAIKVVAVWGEAESDIAQRQGGPDDHADAE